MRRPRRGTLLALAILALVAGSCLAFFGAFAGTAHRPPTGLTAARRTAVTRWVNQLPMALAACLYDVRYLSTAPPPTPAAGTPPRGQSPWLVAATSAPVDCSQARLALARYPTPDWIAALPDVRIVRQDYGPLTQPFLALNDLRDGASSAYRREATRLAAALRLAAPMHAALAQLNATYHASYPLP